MNQPMNFAQLVDRCTDTHQQLVGTAIRTIDTYLAARNFLFGHYIVHFEQEGSDRAHYGKQILKALSQALKASVGRGFSVDNLELMRRFYLVYRSDIFREPISETASRKLNENQWASIPDREIVATLPQRFTFGNDHFFVDLVFYNRLLRCYVLIDLKRDKLTHQDLGQMQMYVNYFDRQVRLPDELPTIGILLCHRKNDALVELTLPDDANIFASKYQLYLPSREELKAQLESITANLREERDEHD